MSLGVGRRANAATNGAHKCLMCTIVVNELATYCGNVPIHVNVVITSSFEVLVGRTVISVGSCICSNCIRNSSNSEHNMAGNVICSVERESEPRVVSEGGRASDEGPLLERATIPGLGRSCAQLCLEMKALHSGSWTPFRACCLAMECSKVTKKEGKDYRVQECNWSIGSYCPPLFWHFLW